MIQFLSRLNSKNGGDIASSPLNYFLFSAKSRIVCIHRLFDSEALDFSKPVIIGGGGLLYWRDKLEHLAIEKKEKVITWGIGLNSHGMGNRDSYPSFFSDYDLNGVRDIGSPYRHIPCASCLHPVFDKHSESSMEVVIFEHHEEPLQIPGFRKMSNRHSITESVSFMEKGEIIVTNTYHGMYWATLLGKRVLVMPLKDSSRFFFFPYPPVMANLDNWRERLVETRCYPNALSQCRELNLQYAEDVSKALGISISLPRQVFSGRLGRFLRV